MHLRGLRQVVDVVLGHHLLAIMTNLIDERSRLTWHFNGSKHRSISTASLGMVLSTIVPVKVEAVLLMIRMAIGTY